MGWNIAYSPSVTSPVVSRIPSSGAAALSGSVPTVGRGTIIQPTVGAAVITGAAPGNGSVTIDFTTASTQDPLSIGGTWSNNTQGVGGNTAPTTGTSLRIATRTGGGVACIGSTAAQANYEDSFAFLPNVSSGNMRVTATVFVASGYNPSDNHEIQIILGCKTSLNYHRWIECLWSIQGGQQTLSQDGDFNGAAFTNIGTSTSLMTGGPQDGDKMIAELYLSSNRVRWGRIRSGVTTWAQDTTNAAIDGTLGNGAGLAVFRRSEAADSVAASLGFTDFFAETF